MGFYKYLRQAWKNPKENLGPEYKKKLMAWRRENSLVRVDKPTNLARARSLGYKAKTGFIIVRSRIKKGGRKRQIPQSGRKPKKSGRVKYSPKKSLKLISEERVNRKYPNLQVLNSYWVGKDGRYEYFEVICVDPQHPRIKQDKDLQWLKDSSHRKRALRGKTSSGRKSRGKR